MSALDLVQDLEMSSKKGKKGRRELTLKERVDKIVFQKESRVGLRKYSIIFQVWENTNSKNTAEKR